MTAPTEPLKKVRIEDIYDDHDCETCGGAGAWGYRIYVDGRLAVEREPFAHCYDGVYFDTADLVKDVAAALGGTVEWKR